MEKHYDIQNMPKLSNNKLILVAGMSPNALDLYNR